MTPQDLLDKHKIKYRFSGRDLLVNCFNPEHEDNSPSMRIDKVLGIFHCLSCGYRGNLYYFYEEKQDKKNILIEKIKEKLQDIRAESIGLALPEDAIPINTSYRVSLETLKEFEAFTSTRNEFVNRIVFPIRDLNHRIACFIGRTKDRFDKKRYLVYPPKSSVPLFPLEKLQPNMGRVVLVEGLFDMLNLYDHGFRNVLCCFGTNTVKHNKLQLLKIMGVSQLDIMFDSDEPGQKAAEEIKTIAEDLYFKVRNIHLQSGDPGDLQPDRVKALYQRLYGD